MIYQLPNGKIIRISVEQFLDMTDDDIEYLCNPSHNIGTFTISPWTGSAIKNKGKQEKVDDASIDFTPEEDELTPVVNSTSAEEEYLEDLPDVEDCSDLD